MNDEMLTAAVEEAGRHGAFITTHARGSASVAMAARTGVRIIHHACFLDDDALHALESREERRLGLSRPALPVRHGQRPR